jgi:hypothetical protein
MGRPETLPRPETSATAAAVALDEPVAAGVLGVGVAVGVVVGAAVVADALAVGVEVVVADALGDAPTACSGSQDSLLPGVVAAAAPLVMATTTPPKATVNRALPAIKVTARRRPRAILILVNIDRYKCEINHVL